MKCSRCSHAAHNGRCPNAVGEFACPCEKTTAQNAEKINKRIHEWLGKCWHEENFAHVFTIKCRHCGEVFRGWPDYTTDLNAVREAELKCIEEYGAEAYIVALIERQEDVDASDWSNEELVMPLITAPADKRAQAVCDVLEGK